MPVTESELEQFHRFAAEKLAAGTEPDSLQDLLDLWYSENPDPRVMQDDILAVKAALRDLDNGDRGIPYEEFMHELRTRYALDENP